MQVRIARQTGRLAEVVAFYRDGVGLPEVGRFAGYDGYDGVFLDLPGTGAHLELTAYGSEPAPPPHPESLLVLYLGSWEAVHETVGRLSVKPVRAANPYWDEWGVTVEDPDGYRVVLCALSWDQ